MEEIVKPVDEHLSRLEDSFSQLAESLKFPKEQATAKFEKGQIILVKDAFKSDGPPPLFLRHGLQGLIVDFNSDGGAIVDFHELSQHLNISKDKLLKCEIVQTVPAARANMAAFTLQAEMEALRKAAEDFLKANN